jgi:hypothetical protein
MPNRVTLLVPIGETRPAQEAARPLPAGLTGKRVGVLDNTKANFDVLARGLAAVLQDGFGAAAVTIRRKLNASSPAGPELLAGLAKECDLVFAGSGD